ncbi:MAG TPA: adenosylhomocysteinase [Firmicutes bacterium]|nr:adenosylhomocysteinase [Bacillota bacterium]
MPVLAEVTKEVTSSGELKGRRVAACLHLEAKTACLLLALSQAGAEVWAAASNPLSTQDDVVDALIKLGVKVSGRRGESLDEYSRDIDALITCHPDLVIDDGGDLIMRFHERGGQGLSVLGACEETTTGITRIRALDRRAGLLFPVIAVNDARSKRLFDNRYGTGQSALDGILRTTNLLIAGKNVVVLGYGWCGKGVAVRARGLGACVIVCEVDPVKANEALMEGFRVMPALEASEVGDVFITVTGCRDVLTARHFSLMKDGALLCNAGHFDVEIRVDELSEMAAERITVRDGIEMFRMRDGRRLYLLGQGRLVNLACADGHPVEIMDMSFSLQLMSIWYLAGHHLELPKRLIPVPEDIDTKVAAARLAALGVKIDTLTNEQRQYLGGPDGND